MSGDDPVLPWNSITQGVISMQRPGQDPQELANSKKKKFGPDGKRKTGY